MEERKAMNHLKLKTEYSFQESYGAVKYVIDSADSPVVGIADINTWGHVGFHNHCKKTGKKALLGLQLMVVPNLEKIKHGAKRVTIYARNSKGLSELYGILTKAHQQFYYVPRVTAKQVARLSDNLVLLSGPFPDVEILLHPNLLLEINPSTPFWNKQVLGMKQRKIFTSDVYYPQAIDRGAYEVLAGRLLEHKTSPQWILSKEEALMHMPWIPEEAFTNTQVVADMCDAALPTIEQVSFDSPKTLRQLCKDGQLKRQIKGWDEEYDKRLDRELNLIADKGFEDYFFIVADLIDYAKKHMLVGPARGSSAGSLVCYLLRITDVNPIEHGLIFERFIDITREDLPDIDIDFPDSKRYMVAEYLRGKYGEECVAQIGTVSRYKPKMAIGDVGKALRVPTVDCEAVKGAIIERSGGDARAAMCIRDTLETTDVGKEFLQKNPQMAILSKIEGHARHTGKHAAGIFLSNSPIRDFCSVDRDGVVMMDKNDVEGIGGLKIDVLGLRTLSVIDDCLKMIGMEREDLLEIDLEDPKAFEMFNTQRFAGIFQFEGYALQSLTKQMVVEEFNDVTAITSLARPGPLHCGGATSFIARRVGDEPVTYMHPMLEEHTKDTLGTIVYQEQVMMIGRDVGDLSWEDVSKLRKAMSKSLGEEFFNKYWLTFEEGAAKKGIETKDARMIWDNMCTFGSWAFNKCLLMNTKVRMGATGGSTPEWMTIEELYEKYVLNPTSWMKSRMPVVQSLHPDGRIYPHKVKAIYRNGDKEVNTYTFEDGTEISCTKDHKFMINGMWGAIGSAIAGDDFAKSDYEKQKYKLTTGQGNIAPSNLAWLCPSCHKKGHVTGSVKLVSISAPFTGMTYDIEMEEHHNFIIDGGIITHNSHAVSYAMISYYCAWLKAYHPLEFSASALIHSKDDASAVKMLRELVKAGYEYKEFDKDLSEINWSIKDGMLIGGFINIRGVGEKTAERMVKARNGGKALTAGDIKKVATAETPYGDIFETDRRFGEYYKSPEKFKIKSQHPDFISSIQDEGDYIFIGKLISKNLRDLNEYKSVVERGGKIVKHNTLLLNFTVEDDTDSIICTINRWDFQKTGKIIAETAPIGQYFLIKGRITGSWRKINVDKIRWIK